MMVRFWGEELPGPGTSIRKYTQCLEQPSSTITQSSRCQGAHNKQGQGIGFLKLGHDLEVEWQNGSGPESGMHGLRRGGGQHHLDRYWRTSHRPGNQNLQREV